MSTEIWQKENRQLHMDTTVEAGVQIVKVEASVFRVMLTEMGWMPLTDEATADSVVFITD